MGIARTIKTIRTVFRGFPLINIFLRITSKNGHDSHDGHGIWLNGICNPKLASLRVTWGEASKQSGSNVLAVTTPDQTGQGASPLLWECPGGK